MTETSSARIRDPKTALNLFLLGAGTFFTLAIVALVEGNTHFFADDLLTFHLVNTRPFLEYLFTPVDVHVLPLRRVASYAIYKLFPLDYRVALLMLLSFHTATLLYLYKTLQGLRETPLNRLLLFAYATNVYLMVPLLWWSSGALRFPYIFFAVGSLYHYLQFRKSSAPRQLLLVITFVVLGLGFYTKGFLIPAYLLGLEVCLLKETGRAQFLRNLGVVAGLTLASALLYQLGRGGVSERYAELHLNWRFLWDFEKLSLTILHQGLLGFVYRADHTLVNLATTAIWALLFLYTVIKRPYNLLVWCVGLGLVALNIFAIGISPRTTRYGIFLITAYRYQFELIFLVVVVLALALRNLPPQPRSETITKLFGSTVFSALAVIGIGSYALLSYVHAKELLERRYPACRQAKEYMDNMLTSIEELHVDPSEGLSLADGYVPRYMLPFNRRVLAKHSRFIEIFGIRASPRGQEGALYRITEQGRIERVGDEQKGPT